jgi:hypothetical protein
MDLGEEDAAALGSAEADLGAADAEAALGAAGAVDAGCAAIAAVGALWDTAKTQARIESGNRDMARLNY